MESALPESTRYYVLQARARRLSAATTVCLFVTALLVMSVGIIGGVYLYRQFARSQMQRFRGWCTVPYDGATGTVTSASQHHVAGPSESLLADSQLFSNLKKTKEAMTRAEEKHHDLLKEQFEIDIEFEKFEKIDVPDFKGGRRGRFIHDFSANKTGIVDVDGKRCFVMPLNRRRVLPPRSLHDLIKNMWAGSYTVDTELVRETMRVVEPPITDQEVMGYYIARECQGVPVYMLEKVTSPVYKRSVDAAANTPFVEFAGRGVLEFNVINLAELQEHEEKQQLPLLQE